MSNQTTLPSTDASAMFVRTSRQTVYRALTMAGLLVAGIVGMQALEKSLHLTFDKPPMPLNKPLPDLAKQLGTPPRYVAEGMDETMNEETVEVLGTKDYLLRTYTDLTKQAGAVGTSLHLNLNYYATGSATPHVPELCWAGNGMVEAEKVSKKIFVVKNVHRLDGSTMDLQMRLISFYPPHNDLSGLEQGTADNGKYLNVAYVFAVNGDYVPTPREVMSQFWKASSPHAYHTKIEVSVPQYCTQEEAEAVISDFIRTAIPAIEECLPARESDSGSSNLASAGAPGEAPTRQE